ncbi:unnamed protein product [Rotaria sordida]|uniref:MULE transposase domain-containing protein n=1 Tax=Rotaria sordida TaxID=392033 RepID=A0A815HA51_9BILA|nr:unnamed protein product [Rotaria sordida]
MAAVTEASVENNIKVTFITSNKGKLLLVLNNYLYKCNKKTSTKKYWLCINNECTMYVHTDTNDKYLYGGTAQHDHEPNPEMVEARQVRQNIKERALKELIPISMIYEEEIAKISNHSTTLAILPTSQEIYPSVAKARQKTIPLLPQSCLFDVPDDFKTTTDGKRFLLSDASPARRERVLIFASDRQLDVLFHSPIIYMDGTFSKSPPHFTQIYIIHAIVFDICLPCAFCLLVNKKSVTYRHIFDELKQRAAGRGKTFSPAMIMTDFEADFLPVFPVSKHYACFFHYCQAIYRQIQHLGKQQDYSTNESFRVLCRKIMALALIPREHVIDSYKEVHADADKLPGYPMQELLIYFEKNRVQCITIQWAAGATRKKNIRTTMMQQRINTLYNRYANNLINASDLLMGLSYVVAKKTK